MYFVVIVSLLIAVSAEKSPPISGLPSNAWKPTGPKPQPCCSAPQYTNHFSMNTVNVQSGQLFTSFLNGRGAYDSINKQIGSEVVVDFSNGTEDIIKYILDFKKLEGFYITKLKDVVECLKFELTNETKFPYNCLPDDATYITSDTIGDRALTADQWYYKYNVSEEEHAFAVYSVKEDGCVDVGSALRTINPKTGAELEFGASSFYDYSVGVCDPDRWFKPPAECENAQVSKVPEQLRRTTVPGGKIMLFD